MKRNHLVIGSFLLMIGALLLMESFNLISLSVLFSIVLILIGAIVVFNPSIIPKFKNPFSSGEGKAKNVSKGFYLSSYIINSIVLFGIIIYMKDSSSKDEQQLFYLSILGFWMTVLLIVALLLLWYRAWESVQDENARTTPGKAIGYLLIPIFNFYWAFEHTL